MEKLKRVEQLIDLINYHDGLYFSENRQEISDSAYDELWFELKELLEDKKIKKLASKLKMPLGEQHSFLDKVNHLVPILSLDKIKSDDSLSKNLAKFVKKYSTSKTYVIESKLDGLTVVMYKSKDGEVVFATRGGSNKGENVTEQMLLLDGVKDAVANCENGMIVRGEVIIPKADFLSSDKYSNARNAVSGALRSKEIGSAKAIGAKYVAYDILSHHSVDEIKDLILLKSLGFTIAEYIYTTETDLEKTVRDLLNGDWREKSPYELDGLVIKPVIKYNGLYEGDGHHAKGQIAVKFKPKGKSTYLRDVEFTIGKDGRMTPVAIYDEIEIDGVKMKRASIGSWSNLQKLNVKIGDKIFVIRSNDVIPQIDSVMERYETSKSIEQPKDSWFDGAHLYSSIDGQFLTNVSKFAKRMGIESANVKTYDLLYRASYLSTYSDLYKLKAYRDDLMKIKGFSEKKVDKLLEEIELSRNASFGTVLAAMQFQGLGEKTCEELSTVYSTFDDLMQADLQDISKSIGSVNVNSLKTIEMLQNDRDKQSEIRQVMKFMNKKM